MGFGLGLKKVGTVTKFLFNRARGIEYGGVLSNGKLKLVKTKTLRQLNDRIDARVGTDYAQNIGNETYNTIMRMAKPCLNGTAQPNNGAIKYLNAHGYMQLYDTAGKKSVLNICEKLNNPISDWLKYC